MRFSVKTVGLCALLLSLSLPAAERIAVVDLDKVFREYYKSRIAEETIREQGETYRAYMLQLNDQRNRLIEDARKARFNAQNLALSAEEQRKAAEHAAQLENAVKEKNSEIQLYGESRSAAMRELEQRKRQEIMTDIRAGIRRQAAAGGFLYVFDSSGRTMNEQPAILLFPENCDLTRTVIEDLNRTAVKPRPADGGGQKTKTNP